MCLVKLLAESVSKCEEFEEEEEEEGPARLCALVGRLSCTELGMKRTLQEHLDVHGVLACNPGQSLPTPAPMLSPEQSPLRLLLSGNLNSSSKIQPLSGNQRPDLLTSLMNMYLVLRLPRKMYLYRSIFFKGTPANAI